MPYTLPLLNMGHPLGYGANRANPTPLIGALVPYAQGGDAIRAVFTQEKLGRWN